MPSRKNYNPQLTALPGRQWLGRVTLAMLVTFGLALLVMSRADNPAAVKLRTSITDALTPVLAFAASPFEAAHGAAAWIAEITDIRAQNVMLKNQNLQLLQWQTAAKEMESENRALRELLNVVPSYKRTYITARVVSDLGGPYVHSALINGGAKSGIRKDQAVVAATGLAGRVVDVGETSARVLLLSDINSRVPVIVERTQEKGILAGNNSELISLSYLAVGSKIKVGDRLVTSGDGGIFPPAIPVGVVTSVDKGAIAVQSFVDPATMDHVSVVEYAP